MENLLGYFFLFIIFQFILISTRKYPNVRNFLLIAFLLRFLCVIIDQYDLITLPDSSGDSRWFNSQAIKFSRNDGLSIIFSFFSFDALLISKIISIFYTIFGESKIIAQSISVALGTASVYLVYYLCLMIWDHRSAKNAAWVTALFPTLILYSSLIIREPYIVFFLLIGLIGIVKFIRYKTITSFLLILISFYILNFFHGPIVLGGFIFLAFLILGLIKKNLIKLINFKINIFSLFILILVSMPIILSLFNYFEIPYLPNFFDLASVTTKANYGFTDTASYPSFFFINHNYELFTKFIIKSFYFLYSPFIWDLKTPIHIIGLFDGMLYLILTIYTLKNWSAIWANPITRIFFLILIGYIIIYGLGVGNFGTGIRHRSKFVVIFIVLASPKIHKFVFSVKKKLYKK